jgi:hypothetical protein
MDKITKEELERLKKEKQEKVSNNQIIRKDEDTGVRKQ